MAWPSDNSSKANGDRGFSKFICMREYYWTSLSSTGAATLAYPHHRMAATAPLQGGGINPKRSPKLTHERMRSGMKRLLAGGMFIVSLMVNGCVNPGSSLPWIDEPLPTAYTLDAGDELHVIVVDEPQLSGNFKLDSTGAISIPTIPRLDARRQTTAELEERIRQELSNEQLRAPEVSVQVVAPRPFFILGEVARPGAYPYSPDMSVLTAVAIAGGFTNRAQTEHVSISRKKDGTPLERRAGRDSIVLPGDVIYVFERII
jgi:polysaccharide biosynthesis/export protein